MTQTPKRTRPGGAAPPAGRPVEASVRPASAGVSSVAPAGSAPVTTVPVSPAVSSVPPSSSSPSPSSAPPRPAVSPGLAGVVGSPDGPPAGPPAEHSALSEHPGVRATVGGAGFGLLPFVVERPPGLPATNATWAWTLRRFARHAVWLLPGYATLYGILSLTDADGADPANFLSDGRPLHLLGWVFAVWLGLLALMALAGLLVATRARRTAAAGLLVALGGTLLMLPFAALPQEVSSTWATVLAVTGGVVYGAGWVLTGWALATSGVFSYVDGGLLMLAGPMLGVGGMFVRSLQTLGALFALVSGIGVAWRAGRLVPQVHPATPPQVAGDPSTTT